jgi:putative sterol carrier protein
MVEVTATENIPVRLDEGASSGLASIVQQFLEQQLADSTQRRVRAARLRGRLGLTATDYAASVTVDFRGDEISISDGSAGPLDATIAGSYQSLTRLLQGRSNPLIEHVRGRLKVTSRLRNLFFPLRVHRLMKLDPEGNH